ncbi:MAG: S-methyl-5'-thioadenosine phosphorylase [Deltaproteobacteria bacterium]|nr:MAG: S-methyl-5'-thioadenosine phosphorylase [Deltaproteobacteria bacterium]
MSPSVLGVIGGSGLYEIAGLTEVEEIELSTPFGMPSDLFVSGRLHGRRVVFLPRHGRGHRILPHEINVRANIWGLKKLGVTTLLSISAVGSMKEEIHPGDIVIPDQLIDRTKGRPSTFFGEGIAAHVGFADPYCEVWSRRLFEAAGEAAPDTRIHFGGTYVCIEGPQFSTRAESRLYRSWGVSVVGMTNLPEAKLAREAEICYATLALATDYDCWHETEADVSVESVIALLQQNVATAKKIIEGVVSRLPEPRDCPCASALAQAIMTPADRIPPERKRELSILIGKYVGG